MWHCMHAAFNFPNYLGDFDSIILAVAWFIEVNDRKDDALYIYIFIYLINVYLMPINLI